MENQKDRQLSLPRNIRQMGNFGDTYKIYVEDFVYTYIHQFLYGRRKENEVSAAVLLGKTQRQEDQEYVFISGAQKVNFPMPKETGEQESGTERRQEFWSGVYQGIKEFFSDWDILGWYINLDGSNLEITPQLQQFFEATYSKGSRFLYYEDSVEKTDAFFVQEQHTLQRISGYAVYYEKNPQMQEFMIAEKERLAPKTVHRTAPPERHEDVAQNYRAIMNKLNEKPQKKKIQPVIYVAGVAVLAIVVATGVTQIGNYQNLQTLEQTLQTLSGAATGQGNAHEDPAAQQESGTGGSAGESGQGEADGSGNDPVSAGGGADGQAAQADAGNNQGESENSQTGQNASAESGGQGTPAGSDGQNNATGNDGQGTSAGSDGQNTSAGDGGQSASLENSAPEAAGSQSGNSGGAAPASAEPQGSSSYTVKRGDSLVSISKALYNTTDMIDEICALNGIEDMDLIYEGQELKMP